MADQHATQVDLPALKREIRQIIEAFIDGYRKAFGSILADLERIEKDLNLLTDDEHSKNTKHADIYLLLSNIANVTAKSKTSIIEKSQKLSPSELDETSLENNPLYKTLIDFIDKPEFKSLDEAHEKIAYLQSHLVHHYCDEALQQLSNKTQSNQHKSTIDQLRGKIAIIAIDENDPIIKTSKIRDALLDTKKQITGTASKKILGIFIEPNTSLEAALDAFITNLPSHNHLKRTLR